MKCLFVGKFHSNSTNISQVEAMRRQGVEVEEFDLRKRKQSKLNSRLMEQVDGGKYDFVLISKGAGVAPTVCRAIAEKTTLVVWYMDPLNCNWNQKTIDRLKAAHVAAIALRGPYNAAKELVDNAVHIHEGFDTAVDSPHGTHRVYNVTFIGNMDAHRSKMLEGVDYTPISAHGKKHAMAVSQSKINLNFVRNNSGCSDRVYKVLAAGGFLLTEGWPELERDFVPGRDLVVFRGKDDMLRKIDYYLRTDDVREAIARNGLRAVQRYSRDNWAERILEEVRKCQ